MKVHLSMNGKMGDESESWCGDDGTAFRTPGLVTCETCLAAVAEYGAECARRLAGIRLARQRGVELP